MVPDLRLTVRSALPAAKLRAAHHSALRAHRRGPSDFGYVMHDALTIDHAASAAAYRAAHSDWPAAVAAEARFHRESAAHAVLTSVSYLPLAGATVCGIPSLAICSLNWADLFGHFFADTPWAAPINAAMLAAYRSARAFIRITPGMEMASLDNLRPVGPVARRARTQG